MDWCLPSRTRSRQSGKEGSIQFAPLWLIKPIRPFDPNSRLNIRKRTVGQEMSWWIIKEQEKEDSGRSTVKDICKSETPSSVIVKKIGIQSRHSILSRRVILNQESLQLGDIDELHEEVVSDTAKRHDDDGCVSSCLYFCCCW